MKEELRDIKIGEGLGIIKFGITRDKLKELLGDPTEIEMGSFGDSTEETTEFWHYDHLQMSAIFEKEDNWKLSTIAVSSPEYLLNGKKLIGEKREAVIEAVKDLGKMEFEDYSTNENPDHKLIIIHDVNLSLWLDQGVLTEIQWNQLWEFTSLN